MKILQMFYSLTFVVYILTLKTLIDYNMIILMIKTINKNSLWFCMNTFFLYTHMHER